MKLEALMNGISFECVCGDMTQEIDHIIYDSRIKTKSGLFIAIEGFKTDGHQFIQKAVENGAKALLAICAMALRVLAVFKTVIPSTSHVISF